MTVLRRDYPVNMPQMAMGGLSESWLFKELGDLHWVLITEGLGAVSSEMADANGDRLYPTFTRIRFRASTPLARFRENDTLHAAGSIERFGSTYFFTHWSLAGTSGSIDAMLMSTFTKRSAEQSNTGLLKGVPLIPEDCAIPQCPAQPEFAVAFRRHRLANERPDSFSTEYALNPPTDVNGVGLLYFAAYPLITDTCEARAHASAVDWHMDRSVIARDLFYSANCDLHDRIVYRRHSADDARLEASLSRASDGKMMAFVQTERVPR